MKPLKWAKTLEPLKGAVFIRAFAKLPKKQFDRFPTEFQDKLITRALSVIGTREEKYEKAGEGSAYAIALDGSDEFFADFKSLSLLIRDKLEDKHVTQVLDVVKDPNHEFYRNFALVRLLIEPKLNEKPSLLKDSHVVAILNTVKSKGRYILRNFYPNLDAVFPLIKARLKAKPELIPQEYLKWIIAHSTKLAGWQAIKKDLGALIKAIRPGITDKHITKVLDSKTAISCFDSAYECIFDVVNDHIKKNPRLLTEKHVKNILDATTIGEWKGLYRIYSNWKKIYPFIKPSLDRNPSLLTNKHIMAMLSFDDKSLDSAGLIKKREQVLESIRPRIKDEHISALLGSEQVLSCFDLHNEKGLSIITEHVRKNPTLLTDANVKKILDTATEVDPGKLCTFYFDWNRIYKFIKPKLDKTPDLLTDKHIKGMLRALGHSNDEVLSTSYPVVKELAKVIKPRLEQQPKLLTKKMARDILKVLSNDYYALRDCVFPNLQVIHGLVKARVKEKEVVSHLSSAIHRKEFSDNLGQARKVLQKMRSKKAKALQKTVVGLEQVKNAYEEKFGDIEGIHEVFTEAMEHYNFSDKASLRKATGIIEMAFKDKPSLAGLLYYYQPRALDKRGTLRVNQDIMKSLPGDWVVGAVEASLENSQTLTRSLVGKVWESMSKPLPPSKEDSALKKILKKVNSVRGAQAKIRVLNAISPETDRSYLHTLAKKPFDVEDLEAADIMDSVEVFDLMKALKAKREKEGDLNTFFLKEAKQKIGSIVSYKKAMFHKDFESFTHYPRALGTFFKYMKEYKVAEEYKGGEHEEELGRIMRKFFKRGNKAIIAHKFKQEDAEDQVGEYAAKLKNMYKKVKPARSRSKTKDLYHLFETNIDQFETYKDKVVFKGGAEEELKSFLKQHGLDERFKEIVGLQDKDIGSELEKYGVQFTERTKKILAGLLKNVGATVEDVGKWRAEELKGKLERLGVQKGLAKKIIKQKTGDVKRLANQIIAKKNALRIAENKPSYDAAGKVLEKLKELAGKPLREQENLLSALSFDKTLIENLRTIQFGLREKPMKLAIESLKNALDTALKSRPDKVNITARLGNKIEDYITMGLHGSSCYRPKGGYGGSMLGMLNDAHEHIILFEKDKRAIGRANLHGAWAGEEFIFVMEKPYTHSTELSSQMRQAAENLCKKIHTVTGIRTIKQQGKQSFEVKEPETRFPKYLDYGHGSVTGKIIKGRKPV